jgi:hypothetical protein
MRPLSWGLVLSLGLVACSGGEVHPQDAAAGGGNAPESGGGTGSVSTAAGRPAVAGASATGGKPAMAAAGASQDGGDASGGETEAGRAGGGMSASGGRGGAGGGGQSTGGKGGNGGNGGAAQSMGGTAGAGGGQSALDPCDPPPSTGLACGNACGTTSAECNCTPKPMFVGTWSYPAEAVPFCAADDGVALDIYRFTAINDPSKASCAVVSSPFPGAKFQQRIGWTDGCLKVERAGDSSAVDVAIRVTPPAWVRTQTADYPLGGVCPLSCP